MPLRILADENIPFVEVAFAHLGPIQRKPGRAITSTDVQEADVLLVRSVTQVNAALLAGSPVQFVGTATIGTDHIDTVYLAENGICFASAPGSNADSVVEFVLAALLTVAQRTQATVRGKTLGIVGAGNIGQRMAERMPALGLRVLVNDPPLAEAGHPQASSFVSLDTILAESDIVSLHVPLTHDGPHATHHLIGAAQLEQMNPDAWLVNACRGAVVDNQALKAALQKGHLGACILDVWDPEPDLDPELLQLVDVGAPHIAGYSFDGKAAGTIMLYDALMAHLDEVPQWDPETILTPSAEDVLDVHPPSTDLGEMAWLHALVQQMYAIEADDARLRAVLDLPSAEQAAHFTALRKTYPRRRAFDRHMLTEAEVPWAYRNAVAAGLKVQLLG
ncbi:MAG: 4-phosphoerythronate dehydrogenase [Rhodothermales bacterium]